MVTIEELLKRFRTANIASLGRCIIIPINKFDPKWDQELLDIGYEAHARDNFVYVPLPKQAETKEPSDKTNKKAKLNYEPPTSRRGIHLGPHWTEEEDKKLIQLVEQNLTNLEISKKMPGRSESAIWSRVSRLRNRGVLPKKPRKKSRSKPAAPQAKQSAIESKPWNKTGLVVGRLSREQIETILIDVEDKELRRKLVPWLLMAEKPLVVSQPWEA